MAKERGEENQGLGRGENQNQNQSQRLVLQGNAYDNFMNGIRTEATKRLYNIGLRNFAKFKGVEHVSDLVPSNNLTGAADIQASIMQWIDSMKKIEKLSSSAINSYVPGVLLFYDMNNVIVNKRMIGKCLPSYRKLNRDRPYTREEISKLLSSNRRPAGIPQSCRRINDK